MNNKLFTNFSRIDTNNLTFKQLYCYVSTDYETECLVIKIPFPKEGLREFENFHKTPEELK